MHFILYRSSRWRFPVCLILLFHTTSTCICKAEHFVDMDGKWPTSVHIEPNIVSEVTLVWPWLADFVDVFTRLPNFTHNSFTVDNWSTSAYGDYVSNTRIMGSNLALCVLILVVHDFLYCALFRYRPCAGPIICLIYSIDCLNDSRS